MGNNVEGGGNMEPRQLTEVEALKLYRNERLSQYVSAKINLKAAEREIKGVSQEKDNPRWTQINDMVKLYKHQVELNREVLNDIDELMAELVKKES